MITASDSETLEEIALLLRLALTDTSRPFLGGYVCHQAKWLAGQVEDVDARDRAQELCSAVYRIRMGHGDE